MQQEMKDVENEYGKSSQNDTAINTHDFNNIHVGYCGTHISIFLRLCK